MGELLGFSIVTFTTFLPMIDPFGNMSIFAAMTERMPSSARRKVAIKGCTFAFLLLLIFGFFGERVFELFGVTTNGLKIVGGIIFVIMGYDMLGARVSRTKVSDPPTPEQQETLDDIAITPLGIPLLCGPGAMTASVLLMSKAESMQGQLAFVLGALAIMLFTFVCLLGSTKIAAFLGPSWSRVILRLMGLMLMVIAIESFFSGLTPIVREMLMLTTDP